MRLLVVTEKCGPEEAQRDGGARLVATLRRAFPDLAVAQFGEHADAGATWHLRYPPASGDRFSRRLARADFVSQRVGELAPAFSDILYVHASMQFAAARMDARTWTFPMFLSPSYAASGERVPEDYIVAERRALANTHRILTPSHLERRQLVDDYDVPEEKIRVIPRGVDTALLAPRVRSLDGPPSFCSVGSIKPQKNTLGLLRLFAAVRARHPGAYLRIVGPVQNAAYAAAVYAERERLGLGDAVEFVGFISPECLSAALDEAHVHLSASACETFGRSIFETLASGLPNVARATGNAAAEHLSRLPYARFVDTEGDALDAVDALLGDLPRLSRLATEVGTLFDDVLLARLLAAEIGEAETLGIADWDGTLFHKDDPARTARSITAFRRYPWRVVVTARMVSDVLAALDAHELPVDWIIGCSGAVVSDGRGRTQWCMPVRAELPDRDPVLVDGEVVQYAGVHEAPLPLRVERYQGVGYAMHWEASKLRAVVRLLRRLDWRGRVRAFGDGPYDEELLAYFDGVRIRPVPAPCLTRQATELAHV